MDSQMTLVVGAAAISLSVVLLVAAVAMRAPAPTGVARSLQMIEEMRLGRPGQQQHRGVARQDLPARQRFVEPAVLQLRRLALRLSPAHTPARLQRLLDFAGNPPAWPLDRVLGAKAGGMLVGALLGVFLGGFGVASLIYATVLGVAGFWLPDLLVHNSGQHRQEEIRRTLADAMDMLTVCVEAGLGFDAALLQVAQKTRGPLAGEFARVLQEVQLGKSRADALAALSARTDVEALTTFIAAVTQADRLGIPIANVLREQGKEMRLIRRQDAEERAQKVAVKILFPLIFCIFPAMMIVIMGPAAIRIIGVFSGGIGAP